MSLLIGMNVYAAETEQQPEEDQDAGQTKITIVSDEEINVTALETGTVFGMKLVFENDSEYDISPTIVVTSTVGEEAFKLGELEEHENVLEIRNLDEFQEAHVKEIKAHEKLELQMKCTVPEEIAGREIAFHVRAEQPHGVTYGTAELVMKVNAAEEEEQEETKDSETPVEPEEQE